MPAPNTSVAPVPPSTEERKQLVIFLKPDEHMRFKQYAADLDRTMSDVARERLMPYFTDNPPSLPTVPPMNS